MTTNYAGTTWVITGASTGIGFGLSKKLLELGATVWMSSLTPANIAAAGEKLAAYGDRIHTEVLDVRDAVAVTAYVERVAAQGRIDYLVNNAGVALKAPFGTITEADWKYVMNTNLGGVINGTTAVYPVMVQQGGGTIINVGSVAGIAPLPYYQVYCASKYAIVGFSESLRYELAAQNIRVAVVCPGAVDTQIFKRGPDYIVDEHMPAPPEAISPERAAEEILDGLDKYPGIIPITDFARDIYQWNRSNPAKVDEMMRFMTLQAERAERDKAK